MNTDQILFYLANQGILTSIVYGPCGDKGIWFSVDVLTENGHCFERPFLVNSFEHAVRVAYKECIGRGWISEEHIPSFSRFPYGLAQFMWWLPPVVHAAIRRSSGWVLVKVVFDVGITAFCWTKHYPLNPVDGVTHLIRKNRE